MLAQEHLTIDEVQTPILDTFEDLVKNFSQTQLSEGIKLQEILAMKIFG